MPLAAHVRNLLGWMLLSSVCTASLAVTYRCTNGTTRYYSDKPCPAGDLRFVAPSGESGGSAYRSNGRNSYQSTETSVARAPEHMKYLNGACAQLNDAIRTAPTRGLNYGVIAELRNEYERKCGEEDREARSQVRKDADQVRSDRRAEQNQKQREAEEAQARAQRCAAMRDAIQSRRRQLASMPAKDVAAFHETEASFNERCLSR